MKAVNLAAKPFVNRRPVIRVATLIWVLALGLSIWNVLRYGDFFRTVTGHRSRLADLEKEIGIAEERSSALRSRIGALQLDDGNGTAVYLNGLIHQRVFPWSRLFDDIEDVLPKDVYLTSLSPQIEKVENTPRRRRGSSTRASRNRAPKAANAAVKEQGLDRVELALKGYSRSEEAMLDLVDRLYASPTFLDPVLSSENKDTKTGLVTFNIAVTYLTRAQLTTPAVGQLADAGSGEGGAAGSRAAGAGLAPDGTPLTADIAGWQGQAGGAEGGGYVPGTGAPGTAAGQLASDPRTRPDLRGQPGGLYGQPGGAGDPQGRGAADQSTRPGFDGAAGGTGTGGTSGRGAGGTRQTGTAQSGVIQPGFDQYGQPLTGAGAGDPDVVVPPRRTPTRLGPTVSATPRFRGGG